MDRRSFLTSLTAAGGTTVVSITRLGGSALLAQKMMPAAQPSLAGQADTIREAVSNLLGTLRPALRQRIVFAFPKGQTPTIAEFPSGKGFNFTGEKYGESMWTNFPVSDVPRTGLRMGELAPNEREAVHSLLKSVLSPMGYQKILDIMDADQIIKDRGEPYVAGHDAYTIGFYGEPGPSAPWMLQFGGHHLGLNVTFVGDEAVCAPLHLGVLPAKFHKDNKTVRALGRENDKAFQLLASLTPQQRQACTITHDISDLVAGPGHPTAQPAPQGVLGSDMTAAQRELVFEISREWVGVLNDTHSAKRLAELRAKLPHTRFAWSGATTHEPGESGEEYFRIHGPSILIEFAPQSIQGGYKLHVHTIMRDLKNDYARQLLILT